MRWLEALSAHPTQPHSVSGAALLFAALCAILLSTGAALCTRTKPASQSPAPPAAAESSLRLHAQSLKQSSIETSQQSTQAKTNISFARSEDAPAADDRDKQEPPAASTQQTLHPAQVQVHVKLQHRFSSCCIQSLEQLTRACDVSLPPTLRVVCASALLRVCIL